MVSYFAAKVMRGDLHALVQIEAVRIVAMNARVEMDLLATKLLRLFIDPLQ